MNAIEESGYKPVPKERQQKGEVHAETTSRTGSSRHAEHFEKALLQNSKVVDKNVDPRKIIMPLPLVRRPVRRHTRKLLVIHCIEPPIFCRIYTRRCCFYLFSIRSNYYISYNGYKCAENLRNTTIIFSIPIIFRSRITSFVT